MMYARVRSTLLAATAALLLTAPAAAARDATVTSFDGTPIAVSFFPAEGLGAGQRAPTVLEGHGWGGSRETDPNKASDEQTGNVGVGPLRRAGFNVLTWDARGFGRSGGTVEVDSKDYEGRDVQALIDFVARQPEALLDGPGDPRVGMTGVSYAGGIEYVTAGIDGRIDAIAPIIGWHSLLSSLYKEDTVKGGWGSVLYAAGAPAADAYDGGLDPHITSAFTSGISTGKLSAEDRAWFESRGPGDELVSRITAPTFIVEGVPDTLFTLHEAIVNHAILERDHVPSKMMWFCGGHGACKTGMGPAGHVEAAVIAWLRHYLAAQSSVDTGPGFEWLADDAQWRSAPDYPLPQGPPLVGQGSGALAFTQAESASGTPITAERAVNALNVAIAPPKAATLVLGEPSLTLAYQGTGTAAAGYVFAQIVDEQRQIVVGNQATPIPVTLDGRPHTISRPLEGIAAAAAAGARYTLQVTGGTQLYGPTRMGATITFTGARVSLPTVAAGSATLETGGGGAGTILTGRSTCRSKRRFVIHLRGGRHLRSARVTVGGRRVPVRRRHGRLIAIVDLRGRPRQTVKVRVVARTRSGRTIRETRRYHTCTARRRARR
jgi:ABC-2 type transport system ATP-binding protein